MQAKPLPQMDFLDDQVQGYAISSATKNLLYQPDQVCIMLGHP